MEENESIQGDSDDDEEELETNDSAKRQVASGCNVKPKEKTLKKFRGFVSDPLKIKKMGRLKKENKALIKLLCDIISKLQPAGSLDTLQFGLTNNVTYNYDVELDNLTQAANEVYAKVTEQFQDLQDQNKKLEQNIANLRRDSKQQQEQLAQDNTDLKMKLDEQTNLLSTILSTVTEYQLENSQHLKDIQTAVEAFKQDKSDVQIFMDGIKCIRESYIFNEEYSLLPIPVKHMIARIQHIFGLGGLLDLGKVLNVEIDDAACEAARADADHSSFDPKLQLNNESCTVLLLKWVKASTDNNANILVERVEEYKAQLSAENHSGLGVSNEFQAMKYIHAEDIATEEESQTTNSTNTPLFGSSQSIPLSLYSQYYDYSSLEKEMMHLVKVLPFEKPFKATETSETSL